MTNRKWTEDNFDYLFGHVTQANMIPAGLEAAAMIIEGHVASLTPVGQYRGGKVGGRLKNSISRATYHTAARTSWRTGGPSEPGDAVSQPMNGYTAHVGTNVPYAAYVEYGHRAGTRMVAGQGYMRRGFDESKAKAKEVFAEALRRGLAHG